MLTQNHTYAAQHTPRPGPAPVRRLALVTCMDARIDPVAAFGLAEGDAHILRNAGASITDDVLRSLAISQRRLGTAQIAIVLHTGCGMDGFDDEAFRAELNDAGGRQPTWDVPGFTDLDDQARRAVEAVRSCQWLPHRDDVQGYEFDVATGRLR
ncbi:MAG: carbonic anhydrase, partial [Actinobacteria bacterium]|nr:carbonic anhydrase [Actinomycetota bacterium]